MTPAELKTLRESLGLTLQWVADQAGVALRSAQYWESGKNRAPDDVAQMLRSLDGAIDERVALSRQLTFDSGAQRVVLVRYRNDDDLHRFRPDMGALPATYHAAMLARIQRALWADGITCGIQYMEPAQYLAWLSGRADSEAARAEWAATL